MAFDEKLADRVREVISLSHNRWRRKKCLEVFVFMVNDKMFVGVESNRLMIRFDLERTGEEMEKEGCSPMGFTNKVMKGFA